MDEFHYDVTELLSYVNPLPDKKRTVLTLAAMYFDPMLTPITIHTEALLQSLSTKGFDCEEKLEGGVLNKMEFTHEQSSWLKDLLWKRGNPLTIRFMDSVMHLTTPLPQLCIFEQNIPLKRSKLTLWHQRPE